MRKIEIVGIRIWPPPRWPLFAQAKRAYKSGGKEALEKWIRSLSREQKEKFFVEAVSLLSAAVEKVAREMEEEERKK